MAAERLRRLAAGFGLFALAFGFFLILVCLLLNGPAVNTFVSGGLLVLFGNLAAISTVAGLHVLDTPTDQKGFGIRNLTYAGWGLVAVTGNVMVAAVIGTALEYLPLFVSPRAAALLIGLPVFLAGWFLLSRFGFAVWRKNNTGHVRDMQPNKRST